jgi:hypothetical protein
MTICHPDQITPEWLNKVLNDAGFSGNVAHFTWENIGAGQVGDNARLVLFGDGDLPSTLVVKFPSSDPVSKQTGVDLQNYAREVFFYEELAASVEVQTPKVFATEFDPETHDFIVVMQDLAPGIQIDQLDGCSAQHAELAMVELAKLHGPRWGDADLVRYPLLAPADPAESAVPAYSMFAEGFLDRYQDRLSDSEQAMVLAIGEVQDGYTGYQGAQTLIHIDYRLDNMVFGGPYPIAVIDWQSINLGCALNDVAYFMGTSLLPADRRAGEEMLVRRYLAQLDSYDVQLSWEECWNLYRHYAPAGLNMAVIASMIVGETPRGNDMFMVMAKRSIAMCEDLDTVSLLAAHS